MPEALEGSGDIANELMLERVIVAREMEHDANRFHMVSRDAESANLVVFIHGTPGDWTIFSPQLKSQTLADVASLVALERPGWGRSELIGQGDDVLPLAEQSALIGPVLQRLKTDYGSDNLVLVGHSLGGSLVPRIAMDHPALVDAVVVLAGDLTDDYSPAQWFNDVAAWWIIRWMVPEVMQKANQEVLLLAEDLAIMKPLWGQIQAPVLVIQGEKDGLVDPRHADFAERVKTSSVVKVERIAEGGHLVHLTHSREINKMIADVVTRDQSEVFKVARSQR